MSQPLQMELTTRGFSTSDVDLNQLTSPSPSNEEGDFD